MHQIIFRLGLRRRFRWGSLQRSPRVSLSDIHTFEGNNKSKGIKVNAFVYDTTSLKRWVRYSLWLIFNCKMQHYCWI